MHLAVKLGDAFALQAIIEAGADTTKRCEPSKRPGLGQSTALARQISSIVLRLAMYLNSISSSKVFELPRTTSLCLLLEPPLPMSRCAGPRTSKGKSCVDLALNANKKGSHHLVLSEFLGETEDPSGLLLS